MNLVIEKLNKYYRYAVIGLFVYMPFHIFLSQWLSTFTGHLDGWKIGKDVFAWAILIFGSGLVFYGKKANRLFYMLWALLLSYTFLHLSLMLTTDQPNTTGLLATIYNTRIIWYVIIGYNLVLLVKNKVAQKKIQNDFIKYLLIVSTVVCVIGLLQWVLPKDVMTHFGYSVERGVKPAFFIDDKPDLPRVMSTIRDPNSLGAFLILPILLLVNLLSKNWKTNKKTLLSGVLLLHLLILFLTFSRSAWLAMLVAGGLYLGLRNRVALIQMTKRYWGLVLIGLVVLIIGAYSLKDQYVVQNVLFHADENTKLADSNELHASLLQQGIDGIVDQPTGHGPGTAGLVAIHNKGILTENYFVQIGYEAGVVGLLMFIAFLTLIFQELKKTSSPEREILFSALIGLILINMFLHTWSNEAVAASVFILLGLSFQAKSKDLSQKT